MRNVPPDSRSAPSDEPASRGDPASDVHVRGRCPNGVCTAIAGDAQAIAWVQALSWQVAYEQRIVQTAPPGRHFEAGVGRWALRIKHGLLPVLVVLRERSVVGYLSLREGPGESTRVAHVESAHLLPTHWRERTGESLLLAATAFLMQREFDELSIAVHTENTRMQWYLVDHGLGMREMFMRGGRMYTRYALPLLRSR